MKNLLCLLLTLAMLSPAIAQGWRPGEKEIRVEINTKNEATKLNELNLNGDFYGDHALLYVTPQELELIINSGFKYKVLIEDLNDHYKDFWQTRDAYHSYAEIIALADSLAEHFPYICTKHIYGTSMGGRQLAALKISSNPAVNEIKPKVLFDGGIHGDEIGASENVIRFARDLCLNYGNDPSITNLIDTREVWLYLMVNPDGRVNMSRYNNNGVDLNRDWGYMWNGEGSSTGAYSQIESKALRECVFEHQFVVHTTYHSGTEYISCPWSYRASTPPDMNHILQLAGVYANVSGYSNIPYGQGFNGMYPINGSTKDSNYGIMGSISWSMEISQSKQPPPSQIMMYYNMNRPSMLAMIEYAGYGLTGIVTDAVTGEPVTAVVFVNNYLPCYTDPENGDYHKYVLPGTYNITVKANGYATATISGVTVTANNATATDFELQPQDHQSIYRVVSSQIPGNNSADPGITWNVIGPPDNQYYSIGKNGWIVVDMQTMIFDGPGPDIMVFEGDATQEGFTLHAGETMDGPWHTMGTGNGTTEFDFVNCAISEARYFKVVDDGDGSGNVLGAGFDLDAIQALSSITGPYIIMDGYVVDDATGNNNGQLDPGETADFIITLKNVGTESALEIVGTLVCSDPHVTILTQTPQVFGDIAVNGTAEQTFTVSADESAPAGHTAILELHYEGANLEQQVKYITISFPDYCYPTANCSVGDGFTGFSLGQINNMNNGCSPNGYGDFTSMTTELESGNAYVVSWTTGYSNQQASLWIDLNDDKIFTDNERLITNFNMASSGTVYNTNFTVPEGVQPGPKRMRIRANWQNSSSDPCANFTYGETEDYTVVFPGSTLNANFTSDVFDICYGGQVQFIDLSTGDITGWDWTFWGGTPQYSAEQNPLVTYEYPGNFDVSLTVTDGTNNSTQTFMSFLIVYGDPETPETPEGETSLCENNANTTYHTNNAMYATDWYWEIQPLEAGNLNNMGPLVEIDWDENFTGTAFLKVASGNLCGQSDFSDPLEIFVMPMPENAGEISGENEVCQEDVTVYLIDELANTIDYEWSLYPAEAGIVVNNLHACQISWSADYLGAATLKVRGINDCGQGDWSPEFEITVEECTGMALLQNDPDINIYPNPNNGTFMVESNSKNQTPERVTVIDITGTVIFEQNNLKDHFIIELQNISDGLYYLKLEYQDRTSVKKIIVHQ
jgi:PKD repeat protein